MNARLALVKLGIFCSISYIELLVQFNIWKSHGKFVVRRDSAVGSWSLQIVLSRSVFKRLFERVRYFIVTCLCVVRCLGNIGWRRQDSARPAQPNDMIGLLCHHSLGLCCHDDDALPWHGLKRRKQQPGTWQAICINKYPTSSLEPLAFYSPTQCYPCPEGPST